MPSPRDDYAEIMKKNQNLILEKKLMEVSKIDVSTSTHKIVDALNCRHSHQKANPKFCESFPRLAGERSEYQCSSFLDWWAAR